jgi:signal peptidase II
MYFEVGRNGLSSSFSVEEVHFFFLLRKLLRIRYNPKPENTWENVVKMLLKTLKSYLILFVLAGGIIGLDQWTKYLVRTKIEFGQAWVPFPEWLPAIRIVHWKNTGAAFGLFPQGGTVFTIIAILVSLAILYYWPRVPSRQIGLRIALALQLAGAVGNLISRITEGIVTDFVALGNFPVFNVADSSISVGVAVLILATWIEERKRDHEKPDSSEVESEQEEPAPGVDPTA